MIFKTYLSLIIMGSFFSRRRDEKYKYNKISTDMKRVYDITERMMKYLSDPYFQLTSTNRENIVNNISRINDQISNYFSRQPPDLNEIYSLPDYNGSERKIGNFNYFNYIRLSSEYMGSFLSYFEK